MTCLIALISSGKGTWKQVLALLNSATWTKVYLVCNEFTFDNFQIDQNKAMKLRFDLNRLDVSTKALSDFFKKEIKDFEVALNLSSGEGLEHMAIVSSLLRAGLGIRFVYPDNQGQVKEFSIFDHKFVEEEMLDEY